MQEVETRFYTRKCFQSLSFHFLFVYIWVLGLEIENLRADSK